MFKFIKPKMFKTLFGNINLNANKENQINNKYSNIY